MSMAEQLSENSRQGFAVEKPPCIGLETDLSQNMHWGCGHVYDETPLDLVVYVRNDPVNLVDPDGRQVSVINSSVFLYFLSIGWTPEQFQHLFGSLPGFDIAAGLSYGFTGWNAEGIWDVQYAPAITISNSSWGAGSYGGGGSAGGAPTLNSEKGAFWNWGRFNSAVTTEMRKSIVSSTLTGLNKRILDEDCSSFIGRMIGNLGGKLKSGITSAYSLVNQGLNAATLHLYGAKYSPALRQGGYAFAEAQKNNIYLGESFFNPASYANSGAYQVSTLIHEMFHLATISSTGNNLKESDLNDAAGGDFKGAVISNCGLK